MNPFEFVEAVSFSKEDLMVDPAMEREYNPFLVNRALSYQYDAVINANEMNELHKSLDNSLQFYYYLHTLVQRKRFAKWGKKGETDQLQAVAKFFGYSMKKAREAAAVLAPEQLDSIERAMSEGEASD